MNFNTWIDLNITASYPLQRLLRGANMATIVSYFKGLEGAGEERSRPIFKVPAFVWRKGQKKSPQTASRLNFNKNH